MNRHSCMRGPFFWHHKKTCMYKSQGSWIVQVAAKCRSAKTTWIHMDFTRCAQKPWHSYERRGLFSTKITASEFSTNFGDFSWLLSVHRRFLTPLYRNRALINPLLLNKWGCSYGFHSLCSKTLTFICILNILIGIPARWYGFCKATYCPPTVGLVAIVPLSGS